VASAYYNVAALCVKNQLLLRVGNFSKVLHVPPWEGHGPQTASLPQVWRGGKVIYLQILGIYPSKAISAVLDKNK